MVYAQKRKRMAEVGKGFIYPHKFILYGHATGIWRNEYRVAVRE
jgi:hypothetical protein